MNNDNRITYFAETDTRNKRVPFGIKAKDRSKHVYVIGKTGMGKSTLLENMAIQDIQNGEGLAFIDPHGKTADLLLEYVPEERIKDVVMFAPFDKDTPIAFNVMEDVGVDKRHLVVSGLMSAFKKIWVDAWSARMEYILTNTLLALLEYPDSTLLGVNKMLSDKDFRKKVVDNIQDVSVRSFWVDEFAKYTERFAAEATPAIQNKIGQFTSNPMIRNIIGQPKSSFDIRKLMDEKKILIINLSKGRVGEQNANLLGSMLITKIYLAAMSRADTPENELKNLPNFYLYVDEFQSFANESFADILSEARKYRLNLTIAHQYIEQMEEEVRDAVFGNVGTMIVFRVGAYDAEVLEKEFAPTFQAQDLVNLGFVQIYLKLMIDGVTSSPFSAMTLPPIKKPDVNLVERVKQASQASYAHPREEVEKIIREMHGTPPPAPHKLEDSKTHPPRSSHESSGTSSYNRSEHREQKAPVSHGGEQDRKPEQKLEHKSEPQERTHQPFREALRESHKAPVHTEPRGVEHPPVPVAKEPETISLSSLKQQPHPNDTKNKKEATQENVQALKDVLSDILKKAPKKVEEKPVAPKTEIKKPSDAIPPTPQAPTSGPEVKEKTESETLKNSETLHNNVREVPEDVLKNILKIE